MPPAVALNRGSFPSQSMPAGSTQSQMVEVSRRETLTVQANLNAGVVGDLVVTVTPVEADGVTLFGTALTAQLSSPAFGGGKANFYGRYDVRGIDRVRVDIKNNNAGAQTLNRASWNVSGDDS